MGINYIDSDIKEIAERLNGEAKGFSGKTVLMTGAGGFLGRYFLAFFEYINKHYLDQPCHVVGMDNFITSQQQAMEFSSDHLQLLKHDVVKPIAVERDVDFVIHAAGIASPFYYRAYPLETLEVATVGAKNMLDLAVEKNASFTFFSSSEIYGDPDPKHVPIPESYRGNVSSTGPRACYDESKRLGETLCHIYHQTKGIRTNMIRPFNIYGPGMKELDYRVLPNFASCIKQGKPLQIYDTGAQTRTFCYITDALVGFLLTILKGVSGEPYNIGNPTPEISILELHRAMEKVLGRSVEHQVIEYPDSYPADEPRRRCPDIRKAQIQLSYQPTVGLEEGLSRFLDWSDQHYTVEPQLCQTQSSSSDSLVQEDGVAIT